VAIIRRFGFWLSLQILIFHIGAISDFYIFELGYFENIWENEQFSKLFDTYLRDIIIIFKSMSMWPTVNWREEASSDLLIDCRLTLFFSTFLINLII